MMSQPFLIPFSILVIISMTTSCMRETKSLKTYELPERSTHNDRKPPEGTVPYIAQKSDTSELLSGRELYQIHCQVCHGAQGTGEHQLKKYGLPTPPSFHLDSVKSQPLSFFTKIMKNGRGAMVSYRARLTRVEREKVAKYIRSLQEKGRKK